MDTAAVEKWKICHPASVDCVFCAIAQGGEGASTVLREERVAAFLDARPVFKGHVLVVPREHVADLAAMPEELIGPLFSAARRVALAMEPALGAQGAFLGLNNKISQSVAHVHVHVVPRRKGDGLRGFFWPRTKYESDEEREDYARRIRQALAAKS
jgi:histidine triad (HIT) family protein